MGNTVDFIRPDQHETGILINTNNQALSQYKTAKKKFAKVDRLQQDVDRLATLVETLVAKMGDTK